MSMMFSVVLQTEEDGHATPKWTVTCERCGCDVSGDYNELPMSIINIKGDIPPSQLARFRVAFLREMEGKRRPIILNSRDDVTIQTLPSNILAESLLAHAKVCPRHGGAT